MITHDKNDKMRSKLHIICVVIYIVTGHFNNSGDLPIKKHGGSSGLPAPARSPGWEISSGSPTAFSETVHPALKVKVKR